MLSNLQQIFPVLAVLEWFGQSLQLLSVDIPHIISDLFGTAVNMAERIAAKAEAGEILVADVVRQLVAGKEFLFNDRGETELRGFEDPVRVYEVRWRE